VGIEPAAADVDPFCRSLTVQREGLYLGCKKKMISRESDPTMLRKRWLPEMTGHRNLR